MILFHSARDIAGCALISKEGQLGGSTWSRLQMMTMSSRRHSGIIVAEGKGEKQTLGKKLLIPAASRAMRLGQGVGHSTKGCGTGPAGLEWRSRRICCPDFICFVFNGRMP
jgi:hypothetical protein